MKTIRRSGVSARFQKKGARVLYNSKKGWVVGGEVGRQTRQSYDGIKQVSKYFN